MIKIFDMTRPGIELQSLGSLVNILLISPMAWFQILLSNTKFDSILIICLHIVIWSQVSLFNISDSIYQVFLSNTNNLHPAE